MTPADDTMPPTRATLRDARAAEQRSAEQRSAEQQSAEQQSVEPELARPRRKRKIVAWVVVSILIVIVASLALLGYRLYERAMAIQAELTDAQTLLPKVTQAVASFDFDAASATLDEASAHTQKAVALTDGWPWSAAEAVPVQGKNAVAVTELAVAAAGLETRVRATAGAPARPIPFSPPTPWSRRTRRNRPTPWSRWIRRSRKGQAVVTASRTTRATSSIAGTSCAADRW